LIKPTLAGRLFRFYRASFSFKYRWPVVLSACGWPSLPLRKLSIPIAILSLAWRVRAVGLAPDFFDPQGKAPPFAEMTALDEVGLRSFNGVRHCPDRGSGPDL
jgi:hypothetical protein